LWRGIVPKANAFFGVYQSLGDGRIPIVLCRVGASNVAATIGGSERGKILLGVRGKARADAKVIKLHVGHRVVDSVNAGRITDGTLDAFAWFEVEACAVLAPNPDLPEGDTGLAAGAGSLRVALVGREELHVLSDKAVEGIEIVGIFGGSQRKDSSPRDGRFERSFAWIPLWARTFLLFGRTSNGGIEGLLGICTGGYRIHQEGLQQCRVHCTREVTRVGSQNGGHRNRRK